MAVRITGMLLSFFTGCSSQEPGLNLGVVTGQALLEKKLVPGLGLPRLGSITEIAVRSPRDGSRDLLIVGTQSVAILELATYRLKKTIRLDDGKASGSRVGSEEI